MKQESIVLELQDLASSDSTPLPELLRKSLLVATKLDLEDFRAWIHRELNGYGNGDDIPEYRIVHAQLKVRNPYHGLQPYSMDDARQQSEICTIKVPESVGAMSELMQKGDSGRLYVGLPPSLQNFLARQMQMEFGFALEFVRVIGASQVAAILDCVRTKILEWSLALEKQGVLGIGMRFSVEEKQRAQGNQHINIHSFQGFLGNASESTINQTFSSSSVHKGDIQSLIGALKSAGVPNDDVKELKAAITKDGPAQGQSLGEKVTQWVGTFVMKAATGGVALAAGATGNHIVKLIQAYYGLGD